MFPPHSTLDSEGMVHFHQVLLGGHDGIDVLDQSRQKRPWSTLQTGCTNLV